MAKFESKYDICEVVTHSSEGECKIDSIKVGIDGIDYFIKSDSGFHGWVSECHLKPAPKEIFVAFFDNGTFGVPMSSIKKIQNVGAKIDGIIINDLDTSKDSYYSYYYNYTADYYNKN